MTTPSPISAASLALAKVLVVGDAMLDRYWFGAVERISPEAPVPVVRVQRTEERLGGAANVARNVVSLGAGAGLLAVVGDDEPGRIVSGMIGGSGVRSHLHVDRDVATTVKLRVIGQRQQMLRIDFDDRPRHEALLRHLDDYRALLGAYDLIVLSDYGKGGLMHIEAMIDLAHTAGKPILVDPKGDDYSRYAGATMLTPNKAELREVIGSWKDEADLDHRVQRLRAELRLQAVLLTRSDEGMTLYSDEGAWSVPAQAREVFDVSGAGDTVIGVLAAMLAAGAGLRDAVAAANRAGGIVVGKLGTSTVDYAELFGRTA
jgi:rfaE bifunctional protein kinase chain/domain